MNIATENNLTGLKGKIYNSMAISAEYDGRIQDAISNYQLALKNTMLSEEDFATGIVLGNLAQLHIEVGNYAYAQEYLDRLKEHAKLKGDKLHLSTAHDLYGSLLFSNKKYKKALLEFDQAYKLYVELDDQEGLADVFLSIAETKMALNQYSGLEPSLIRSRNIFKELGSANGEARSLNFIAEIANKNEYYAKAIQLTKQSLELNEKIQDQDIFRDGYLNLAKAYEGQKRYKKAYKAHKKYSNYSDSIKNKEAHKALLEVEHQTQINSREQEFDILKKENISNQSNLESIKKLNWLALIALCLGTGLLFAFWKLNRRSKNYNSELEIEVERRTTDLNVSTAKLKKSNEELENFAYITSHDLKEPLNNIQTFNALLSDKVKALNDEDLVTFTGYIHKNTQNMKLLIENILEFSKLTSQDFSGKVNLVDVLEKIKENLLSLSKEKNASIEYGPLPMLNAHPAKLFQIFKNLIENGIKYNDHKKPQVSIEYARNENKHLFKVKDNGIGIEEKYQDQIFHMFKRLHNRKEYDGSGMGLPIVKKAIEVLGGEISLSSTPDLGTLVEFWLPVEEEKDGLSVSSLS